MRIIIAICFCIAIVFILLCGINMQFMGILMIFILSTLGEINNNIRSLIKVTKERRNP